MPHSSPLVPDQERLRAHLDRAHLEGRVVRRKTAQEIATWFAAAIGPGFATFRSTGVVTGHFYAELGRLYDMREPEAQLWLHNLTRFALAQPLATPRRRRSAEQEDTL